MNNPLNLYPHNLDTYSKVKEAYKNGEQIVGIVQATGTGKSYNALQLAYENKGKKIIYVVPSHGIIEHIKNIINSNPNLDFDRDFPNLEFRTYQSFTNMERDEIAALDIDLLILDEFHHIGAPVWGARINEIIETHPDMQIFGMTAYTVRDRGTAYERDMAEPSGTELFSDRIANRYDLCDAMIDGVLPKPTYRSAHVYLEKTAEALEERLAKLNPNSRDYIELSRVMADVRKRIHEAPGIADVVKENIKPNGKYIYFCPLTTEAGVNDMETIMAEAKRWFLEMGLPEEDIIFYQTTSEMGAEGKRNREAFYHDVDMHGESTDGKLRVMFAINQYNEGIHAPNIDGVIMGRGTSSDIVYFEQLGRALAVRGETHEEYERLEKLSVEELMKLCQGREIVIKGNETKESLIQMLIAPMVIDLTDNFSFISELQNNLRDRIKEIQTKGLGNKKIIKLSDASFDIEIENQDLFEMLTYVFDRVTQTWEDWFELAEAYYNHHHDLLIPNKFKTTNGYEYDENGKSLGNWLQRQKDALKNGTLSPERIEKLKLIGFVLDVFEESWEEKYRLAEAYYNHHHNLLIPNKFKTTNGYEYDANGKSLGNWLQMQKKALKNGTLSPERIEKLKSIGFVLDVLETTWEEKYRLATAYFEHHHNLVIPRTFKTTNGYEYDETGENLGNWLSTQRASASNGKLSSERLEKLKAIGFVPDVWETAWEENYRLAEAYYNHHHNLLIPNKFKTTNGYEYDENGVNLGEWLRCQRGDAKKGKLSSERLEKLKSIGFVLGVFEESWEENYRLAMAYFEYYHNLSIPYNFKTTNGYEYDETGKKLGGWLQSQKKALKNGTLSPERIEKLKLIGFVLDVFEESWEEKYRLATAYFEHHRNLLIPARFKTTNGYEYDENGKSLGTWLQSQKDALKNGTLSLEKIEKLKAIGLVLDIAEESWEENYRLATAYYEHHHNLLIPNKFKTTNGYEYDENGQNLGIWLGNQKSRIKSEKVSPERIEKLKAIGFVLDVAEESWEENYKLAATYFEYHHNLFIPRRFKTINGYEYDENGKSLGVWVQHQKKAIKNGTLSSERKNRLDAIDMIWDVKLNQSEIKEVCQANNIDYKKNKKVLDVIPCKVLIAKINYLLERNIPLTENGILHEIFSMSSPNMKVKYGFTLEEMVTTYYHEGVKRL